MGWFWLVAAAVTVVAFMAYGLAADRSGPGGRSSASRRHRNAAGTGWSGVILLLVAAMTLPTTAAYAVFGVVRTRP